MPHRRHAFGYRWSVEGTILWRLSTGPMRTSELRRSIPEITERMLIRHLHELVQDGIVVRRQERDVPSCVHYSISNYGLTLLPVLELICGWGRLHLQRTAKKNRQHSHLMDSNI